jgi:hypothetical protein
MKYLAVQAYKMNYKSVHNKKPFKNKSLVGLMRQGSIGKPDAISINTQGVANVEMNKRTVK